MTRHAWLHDLDAARGRHGQVSKYLQRTGGGGRLRNPLAAEQDGVNHHVCRDAVVEPANAELPSEREVSRLAVEGLTNREIAGQLSVIIKTVESHLTRVFVKMGVRHRVELVRAFQAAEIE